MYIFSKQNSYLDVGDFHSMLKIFTTSAVIQLEVEEQKNPD